MPLNPGTRIGAYEIIGAVGRGGMGEVYRARDTKLGRDVALKILPDAFAHDPERLARFDREARTLRSRDGRELFFLDASRRMTVVTVERTPSLRFGPPQTLFATAHLGLEGQQRNFDLSPDGKRFLMVKSLRPPADVPALVLVQNWFQELRAKLP